MKQCLQCGQYFRPGYRKQAQKFCNSKCSDAYQWNKRKAGLTTPKGVKIFDNKGFFDWREYPNTVII